MTDENRADMLLREPKHFEHWCEESECKQWGSLGYDIRRGETRWYCFEHKWQEYPNPKREVAKNSVA
ncbi:hypothetical protein LJR251_002764 [Rhizobium rhizogenes]|uniref:hypothetical protein n=1 Tax=Rhizobium rhizogenes TaxID=359 RepID=UPI003ECC3F20